MRLWQTSDRFVQELYVCTASNNAIVQREILNLEKCLCDNSAWVSKNKLKLNNDKIEVILFGSKKHLVELNIKSEHGTPWQKCHEKI